MEFEKNAPVSDEQRRLAETKKITLQPVHKNITPDDVSDSAIANSHINGQPIGNIQSDIEQDASVLIHADKNVQDEAHNVRKQSTLLMTTVIGMASILIIVSLFIILNVTA